jgi:hypothetical protein
MYPTHQVRIEADDGVDVLFVCEDEGCGRRVIVRRSGDLLVLDQGDFFALHAGGSDGLELATDIAGDQRRSA